jgi:hypothetical protein
LFSVAAAPNQALSSDTAYVGKFAHQPVADALRRSHSSKSVSVLALGIGR